MLRLRGLMMAYKCTSETRHNLNQWWLNVNTILENKFNHFSVEMLLILIKTNPFENYMFKAMVTYPHSLSHGIKIIEIYFVGVFCCNVLFIIFIGICGNNQSSWFHQSCMQCGFYFRHTWVPEGKTSFFLQDLVNITDTSYTSPVMPVWHDNMAGGIQYGKWRGCLILKFPIKHGGVSILIWCFTSTRIPIKGIYKTTGICLRWSEYFVLSFHLEPVLNVSNS